MDDIVKSDTHLLKKPLSVAELIGNGAQFEVDTSAINNAFYEDFASDDNDDVENSEVDNETLQSPWTKSFDELRQLMTPISEHIFKRITREGIKEQGMVPEKARVALRYSAYWEGECAPFDSSMLRGTKFEFETGRNIVLEGLEAAVRSMHPYEQAEFIISYKLLFHELGCPPRIKPRADGLFKIEVISFMLIGDQQSLESIAPEDRCKFSIVYPKARDMHLHGKDCVKRGSYHSGITAFENAISSLNYCRLADEKDEQQQRELLITLNTNLMVCYNKLNIPKRACIAMKALRHLTQNQPSCKALFQEGRALVALGEYKRARLVFVQAQEKQPNNKEISDEIIKVDERVSKYKQSVREMWSRALSVQQQEEPKESNLDVGNTLREQQFKRDFLSQLEKFEKSPQQSIHISRKMYTDEEFDVLRLLAVQRNFKLSLSPLDVDQLTLAKLQIK
ncbi:inactive peptidyl-prolyl cis-trans isomerase shutdown [Drosophila sulfurigaster albostrigata]|uniref:inactive peptidyl-prolyl cis-trans isomerase shutdown n=1 Tax=Drosophila sulfurigaster albostrigata TaxID=89887 RepID=UPI002D21AA47|nr:inactive peptidyl-prolyl cis-trans isomerase shutdown [Drosophila sulfurigaster albostrigata]